MADDRARSRRILEGPLALELLRFGTPLAIGTALQVTFNLVDAWILGKMPHDEVGPAMGALGICDQMGAIGTILCYGVSTGTAARLALLKGKNDLDGVRRSAWQSILVVAALSLVTGILGIGFAGSLVRTVVGAKGDVAAVGEPYLAVMLGGGFSVYFLFQLSNIARALGSAKTPVALLVLGNVINIALAILFVFGPDAPPIFGPFGAIARTLHIPRLGMLGAAWGTILARVLVLVPMVVIVARRFDIRPRAGEWMPDGREIRRLVGIAWPLSAQFVLRLASALLVTSLVARAFTTPEDQTASTAIGLVFRLDTMALFVAMGWGSAAQTFVGQSLGAKLRTRARAAGLITAGYDVVTNIGLCIVALRWGSDVLSIFDSDPAPLAIADQYLRIVAPSYILLGVGVVLANAISGAGATRTTFAADATVLVGFQLPVSLIALNAFHVPIDGLFWCVVATNAASAIVFLIVYLHGKWMDAAAKTEASSVASIEPSG